MDLRITSIEFSRELLLRMASRYPTVVKSKSSASFEMLLIPDKLGAIEETCIINTNMGPLYYPVLLRCGCHVQVKATGINNSFGISALYGIKIPRGSEYRHTVYLYNPSVEKKIRIYRIGSSDDDITLYVRAATEMGAFLYCR